MSFKEILKKVLLLVKNREFMLIFRYFDYYLSVKFLRRKEVVRKVNDYPMVLSFQESGISKGLMVNRRRENVETEVVKEIVKLGMCILDIGANIGYYTILMGKLVGDKGRIYAYEPYPSSFDILNKNVELNNLSGVVEVNNLAVSVETTVQRLYLGRATNAHTLIDYNLDKNNANHINIRTRSIREILTRADRKVDLIRMDIEGYERQLLSALGEDISSLLPERIFFEVHPLGDIDPDPTFVEPFKNISGLGYYPELVVSSRALSVEEKFRRLNYSPSRAVGAGQKKRYLYENISPSDLLAVAASRPKMTRAVLLKRQR